MTGSGVDKKCIILYYLQHFNNFKLIIFKLCCSKIKSMYHLINLINKHYILPYLLNICIY